MAFPQFAGPHYPAVNSLGHIIVSDFHNHSIKVGATTTASIKVQKQHSTNKGTITTTASVKVKQQQHQGITTTTVSVKVYVTTARV